MERIIYVSLFTQILDNMFQDPHWVPETQDSTKSYMYYYFPIHTYL